MSHTRRMLWLYTQAVCSGLKQQSLSDRERKREETIDVRSTMNVSKKFIKILKSSFKAMNSASQIIEGQKINITATEAKIDRVFCEVIDLKDSKFDNCVILALSYLYMSYVYIDNKDNIHISKKYLTKSLELLKEKELDCKAILIAMRVHNELSYIEIVTENYTEAESYLNQALQLYCMFTKEKDDYPIPIDVATILDIEDNENCKCLLERIYYITLEGLLEIDNIISLYSKRTNIPKAATYMHKFLEKQLNASNTDYITWATSSAELSMCFTKYGRFTEARNHLGAASFMIQQYFIDIYHKVEQSNTEIKKNISECRYRYASSRISYYWAKYGLSLLNVSREKTIIRDTEDELCEAREKTVIRDTEDELCEASTSQSSELECATKSERQPNDLLIFSDIEKDLDDFAPITDKCPLDYSEAKQVFVSVLKWFNDVKEYTTNDTTDDIMVNKLDDQCSVAIGVSLAYRYLAYFEQDKSNKIKLHKRQLDVIEKVIETSKPAIGTELYKQLSVELIFSYTAIVDIMTEHLRADKPGLSKEESLEIKQLITRCLTSLKLYLSPPEMLIN